MTRLPSSIAPNGSGGSTPPGDTRISVRSASPRTGRAVRESVELVQESGHGVPLGQADLRRHPGDVVPVAGPAEESLDDPVHVGCRLQVVTDDLVTIHADQPQQQGDHQAGPVLAGRSVHHHRAAGESAAHPDHDAQRRHRRGEVFLVEAQCLLPRRDVGRLEVPQRGVQVADPRCRRAGRGPPVPPRCRSVSRSPAPAGVSRPAPRHPPR